MPISDGFKRRLWPIAAKLHQKFNGPFHLIDEIGIELTCHKLFEAFKGVPGFMEFFAVKATPTPAILEILHRNGFGFDCSSIHELRMAEDVIKGHKLVFPNERERLCNAKIMFSANNTSKKSFAEALRIDRGGVPVIINIDDISMIEMVADLNNGKLPETICFRYNPGPRRSSGSTAAKFGDPEGQKYGVPHEKILDAYKRAQKLGAKYFGIHTMIASNCLNIGYIQETIQMLLEVSEIIHQELGIKMQFINMGGGIGIPYKPNQKEFPIAELGSWAKRIFDEFGQKYGWNPDFNMECGRYITGPNGVLVSKVRGKYEKYQTIIGLDVDTNANPRPKLYGFEGDGYHHIDVISQYGHNCDIKIRENVSVCDSLCENNGRFANQRDLPQMTWGDFVVIQDTGAHAIAMGDNYNSGLKPQILLMRDDATVVQIRREERVDDLDATLCDLNKEIFVIRNQKISQEAYR